jgi:predicted acyl esterase
VFGAERVLRFLRLDTLPPLPPSVPQSAGRAPQYYVMDPGGHCPGGAIKWHNATWGLDIATAFSLQLFANTLGGAAPAFADPRDAAAVATAWRVFESTPVLLYVLGPGTLFSVGNLWVGLPALPATTPLLLYFAPGGLLAKDPPAAVSNVTFKADPHAPIPTLGGNNLMIKPCGPQDQSVLELEHAESMVVFTSEPVEANIVVCGDITVEVTFVADTVDVDIAVTLLDVFPIGTAMLVQDGVVRARWRNGPFASAPALLTPGQSYTVLVDIGAMSYVYNAGHRIRVTVQGSNAPRFSVNPNNGAPLSDNTTAPIVAHTAVLFGGSSASVLTLPIAVPTEEWLGWQW